MVAASPEQLAQRHVHDFERGGDPHGLHRRGLRSVLRTQRVLSVHDSGQVRDLRRKRLYVRAPGPQPGDPCFNSSMSNSICQPGTYSANLSCIPTLYNVTGETCDGVDNDCDGVIDNGAPAISATCGVGACLVTVWGCKNGTGSNLTCVPGYPTPEVCDGVDNDCDGVIDNGNVCAQPVLGVAVVPIARCIEGRLSPSSTDCYAHFGYYNTDPFFAVTRPYPNGMYNSLTSYVPENTLCPMPTANVPQYFPPNASNSDAFRVAMCCGDGASVVWSLGDGNDNFLQATVYASSAPPCETFVGQSSDLVLPISIFVDSPCVLRQNGTCSVALGYQNPNSGSPVYYVPPNSWERIIST